MRLASYIRNGQASFGLLIDGGVVDLRGRLQPDHQQMQDILAPDSLRAVAELSNAKPDFPIGEVELVPPVPRPEKIFCIGLNYATHVAESTSDAPTHPIVFMRTAKSQVGHRQDIIRPSASTHFDFEGEMALVIGKPGRHIPRENALDHVAGYTCYNDGSVRDFQRHTTQWGPGKNFDRSGGCGPWIMTSDEIPDPSQMVLMTRINGVEEQKASVSDLIFDVPALIEYISTFTELETGDLIVTGTTGGVGVARTPPVWLKDGDVVEIEVSPIGVLRNVVRDEDRAAA